jgi:hypothetical protein
MEKNKKTGMSWFLLTLNEDWADEHNVPALAVMDEKRYEKWSKTRLSISANLGNSGYHFMENEQGMTGAELVKSGTVSKMKVTPEFAKIFKKADLEDLSLSDIFDGEEYDSDDDDDDDYEEGS